MSSDLAIRPAAGNGENHGDVTAEHEDDSPYVKDLQKAIRNTTKKLNAASKLDAILAEYPGKSLDELVKARKINADQKEQALRKPILQQQLQGMHEQLTQVKKMEDAYRERLAAEKASLLTAHEEEVSKLKDALTAEQTDSASKSLKNKLLLLSRFLRAAAARRQLDDQESEESKAFEGLLLLVYGGDSNAVLAMMRLLEGSEETVPSIDGTNLSVTYASVRKTALEHAPPGSDEVWNADTGDHEGSAKETLEPRAAAAAAAAAATAASTSTDPTVAHAASTEQGATTMVQLNGGDDGTGDNVVQLAQQGTIDDGAANAAAEAHWDTSATGSAADPLAESYEIIPRDPQETDTPHINPASAGARVASWADEAANSEAIANGDSASATTAAAATSKPADPASDGFHEVVHHNHRGRGRGGDRDREHRGGFRGRGGFDRGEGGRRRGGRGGGGFRGDRGSGEGGFRGGRGRGGPRGGGGGGPRGGRGADE